MREGYTISCPCGYELWVPRIEPDSVYTCLMCQAELTPETAEVRALGDGSGAGPFDEPSQPEHTAEPVTGSPPAGPSPFEDAGPGSHPYFGASTEAHDRAEDGSRLAPPDSPAPPEAAEDDFFRPSSTWRSPFEDDTPRQDTEPESTAKPVHRPAAAPSAPGSRTETRAFKVGDIGDLSARDPFEAPPVEERPQVSEAPARCPECGREYQGEHDRVRTVNGIRCLECAHQSGSTAPDTLIPTPYGPSQPSAGAASIPKSPEGTRRAASPGRRLIDTESDGFRRILIAAGVGVIGLTVVMALVTDFSVPDASTYVTGPDAASGELPEYAAWLVRLWQVFSVYFGGFLALYLVLDFRDRLPHEHAWPNLILLSWVLILLLGISATVYALSLMMAEIFVAGQIWMMLVWGLGGLAQIFVLMNILDFGIRDFILLVIVFALVQLPLQLLSAVAYAGIYEVAT